MSEKQTIAAPAEARRSTPAVPLRFRALRATLGATDRLSPRLAARLALPLFLRVGSPIPVRPEERATMDGAERGSIRVNGRRVVTYRWGGGHRTVALVHGWRGRAAQFAPLVRELRAAGFTVLAFDAPANGSSPGRRTDVRDYEAALHQLQARHGAFEAVVAHSFGMLGATAAIRGGLAARRLVGIAGVAEPRYLVEQFAGGVGLGPAATEAFAVAFQRSLFDDTTALERYSSIRNPLPGSVPLLLLHDRADAVVAHSQALALRQAHPVSSTLLSTTGLGHRRILSADSTLDAVLEFVTE